MNTKNILKGSLAMVAMTSMMVGCTSDFLEQDPLSFYEPAATYSTGLVFRPLWRNVTSS